MRPIRTPATGGPRKIVSRFAAWKNAVASATSSLLLADELRHDRALHGEVRRDEDAGRGDEREQQRETGARPRRWRSGIAASSGARARSQMSIVRRVPSRAGDRAAPEAEHRDRHDLRDDHPRHALRRPGRAQHEPRQREPRHLRAERRDHLGREQRGEAAVAEQAHGSAAAPKLTIDVPRARCALAAAELVEQRLEPLAELLELRRRQLERRRRRLRRAAPARRELVLAAQRVADALLLARDELVAEHGRLEPVGRRTRSAQRSRATGARGRRRRSPSSTKPHLASARRW